jgi:uncharacterized protein YaaN involved in tellurite resistance
LAAAKKTLPMNDTNPDKLKPTALNDTKPGFFQRIFTKLDQSMKEKADKQADNACCSENSKKDGNCC